MTDQELIDFETLQEQALQRELSIFASDGETLLTADELRAALMAYAEETGEGTDEEKAPPPKAKTSKPVQSAPRGKVGRPAKASTPSTPAGYSARDVDPALLERCKLSKATDEDRALADKYDYPLAIPGAKPYRTAISFQCGFGGGERPAGSIVLLRDEHAANKLEFLTRV